MTASAYPAIFTEDGTVIVRDPKTGLAVSSQTRDEAGAELRRLLAAKEVA